MTRATIGVAGILVAALATSAGASIVYSTSFEAPTFVPGSIIGQGGWLAGSGTGQSQSIVDTFARTGSQSLQWDNTTLDSFYSVRRVFDGQVGAITPATPLEISTWLYIDPSSSNDRVYGIYGMNSPTSTLGGMNIGMTIGGDGGIRAGTTWSQTYSGAPLYTDPALVGDWIKMVLFYDGVGGGARVYDAGLNQVWSTTFASVNLPNSNGFGTQWNVNLGTDYSGSPRLGIGYMDDFSVVVIPAPASLALLGLGGLALRRRR